MRSVHIRFASGVLKTGVFKFEQKQKDTKRNQVKK